MAKPKRNPNRVVMSRKVKAKIRWTSIFFGALVVSLTALSLDHFAHGITELTGDDSWLALALAIGVELGYIGIELARVLLPEPIWRNVGRMMEWTSRGCLAVSAAMNVLAFTSAEQSWSVFAAAAALGVLIPILIFVLARIAITIQQFKN